ncbi:MAG: Gfo/Idh/MocA family oxidoreductase [Candidatus Latescibacteria bacterium]|nr:Gfo/Idh/MocA family oxidoreductase [Candidatus Latescibacterota bacterium]
MSKVRIAIVGAGNMARVRGRAFLDTGRAEICGVAARRTETAERCARELGCGVFGDDFRKLVQTRPDAVLIEVPHRVQDEATMWALDAGFDLLIGGCLASSRENGRRIVEEADRSGRIVEAGFQRRYDPAWEEIRRLVTGGELGPPVMAVTMALWNADPDAWYYEHELLLSECGSLDSGQADHRFRIGQPEAEYGARSRNGRNLRGPDRIRKRCFRFGHCQLYRP